MASTNAVAGFRDHRGGWWTFDLRAPRCASIAPKIRAAAADPATFSALIDRPAALVELMLTYAVDDEGMPLQFDAGTSNWLLSNADPGGESYRAAASALIDAVDLAFGTDPAVAQSLREVRPVSTFD